MYFKSIYQLLWYGMDFYWIATSQRQGYSRTSTSRLFLLNIHLLRLIPLLQARAVHVVCGKDSLCSENSGFPIRYLAIPAHPVAHLLLDGLSGHGVQGYLRPQGTLGIETDITMELHSHFWERHLSN